jgi:hypothetical protein
MTTSFLKAFAALSTEREAIRKREEKLLSDLRDILGRFGYRLEPIEVNGSGRRGVSVSTQRGVSSSFKPLACTACGRTFALPLHLGRHLSAMHRGEPVAKPRTTKNGSPKAEVATKAPRRPRMALAARRAAARRMKAYWRKRRALAAKRSVRARRAAA